MEKFKLALYVGVYQLEVHVFDNEYEAVDCLQEYVETLDSEADKEACYFNSRIEVIEC